MQWICRQQGQRDGDVREYGDDTVLLSVQAGKKHVRLRWRYEQMGKHGGRACQRYCRRSERSDIGLKELRG